MYNIRWLAWELERSGALVRVDDVLLDFSRHDAGKRAPQIRGAIVHRLIARKAQSPHRGVRDLERQLEIQGNLQQPVESVRIARLPAEVADAGQSLHHRARGGRGDVQDHLVSRLRGRSQSRRDEAVDQSET